MTARRRVAWSPACAASKTVKSGGDAPGVAFRSAALPGCGPKPPFFLDSPTATANNSALDVSEGRLLVLTYFHRLSSTFIREGALAISHIGWEWCGILIGRKRSRVPSRSTWPL